MARPKPEQLAWTGDFVGFAVTDGPDDAPADTGGGGDATQTGTTQAGGDQIPRPMEPDCQIVRGVVAAPDNFVLCAEHGHILDLDTKQIVAPNLKEFEARHPEYGKLPRPMLADCTPEPGRLHGPPNHVLCTRHGHVLDVNTKQIIAWSPADYAKRYPAKPAPGATKPAAPKFDKAHAQDSLKNILTGIAILLGEFGQQSAPVAKALDTIPDKPCGDHARAATKALADANTKLHVLNEAIGEFVAEFPNTAPVKIPTASHDARDALGTFEEELKQVQSCTAHPPPFDPGPPPPGIDPDQLKALNEQKALIYRRDALLSMRQIPDAAATLADIDRLRMELETAFDVARAIIAG